MCDIKLNHLHILLSPVGFLFSFLLVTVYSITEKKKIKQKKGFNVKENKTIAIQLRSYVRKVTKQMYYSALSHVRTLCCVFTELRGAIEYMGRFVFKKKLFWL